VAMMLQEFKGTSFTQDLGKYNQFKVIPLCHSLCTVKLSLFYLISVPREQGKKKHSIY